MAVGSKSLHCILLFYCAVFTLIALAMLVNTSMMLADLMAHKAFVEGDTGKADPLSLRTKASGHLANADNHHGTVNLLGAPSLLVAAAVLSVAVGAFGFYATLRRNVHLLRILVLLMIIVVVMELSGGIWAITVRSSSTMSIRASLIHNMEDYGVGIKLEGETKTFGKKTSPVKTHTHPWDILQKKLECCGVDGPGDYMSRGSMPFSCCSAAKVVEKGTKKRTAVVATTTAAPVFSCVTISQQGCLEALDGYASGRLALVGSLGIAAAFIYVCELHFTEENIQRESGCYDEKTGAKIMILLQRPRLKIGAIPSQLVNCPQYLSTPTSTRESVEERRVRTENRNLEAAIAESLCSKSQYDNDRKFTDFNEFLSCLEKEVISNDWTVIKRDNSVTFAVVEFRPSPVITVSAIFSDDLHLTVFKGNVSLKRLGKHNFPEVLTNINELVEILELLKLLSRANESSVQDQFDTVHDILIQLISFLDEEKQKNLEFIIEQLNLLNYKQERFRYSPHFSIFCSILFCISPHAYKFLRSSGNLILPHPRTIKKLCATYNTDPQKEQSTENFLSYIKNKFKTLKDSDHIISLMIDEIHVKPYLDYKGGNILGAAYNTEEAAKTAYVFMIQSLLSSFKEVVHILPVRTINAEQLFVYIKQTIIGLQTMGFKVVCVVSDNNSLNRKSMTYFSSPPKMSIVYQHPSDPSAPLFFLIDSVHILKCIRNNWINQKDSNQTLKYPSFENHLENDPLLLASFSTLKCLHQIESSALVKYSYGMSLKSLYPSNFEKQNVKLVLNIFNQHVVQGLLNVGERHSLLNYKTTADFVSLICSWWSVVNVRTLHKGIRFRDPLQKPLTLCKDEENYLFLEKFLLWLDLWKDLSCQSNCFSKETHLAVAHTTHGLLEMARYCIHELKFEYFLPGKIQTDALEARFGKYRTMAGLQYLISVRQIFEVESKLRMQNCLPLTLTSNTFGELDVDVEGNVITMENHSEDYSACTSYSAFDIEYSEEDFLSIEPFLPILTYLSGYCARAVLRKIKCEACSKFIVLDKEFHCELNDNYSLIRNVDRGGLLLPHPDVVNAIIYNYITVQKLLDKKYEKLFLNCNNQRELVLNLTVNIVNSKEFFLNGLNCIKGHSPEVVLNYVIAASTNALLNNYVKRKNDHCNQQTKKKRKINTVKNNILDCK